MHARSSVFRLVAAFAVLVAVSVNSPSLRAQGDTGSTGDTGSAGSTGSGTTTGSGTATGSGTTEGSGVGGSNVIGMSDLTYFSGTNFRAFTAASGNAIFVPFSYTGLGNYSLTSVAILLAGTLDLSGVSVSITSNLPVTSAVSSPDPLVTFSATGNLTGGAQAVAFSPGQSPSLAPGTTYYLRVAETGPDVLFWLRVMGDHFAQTFTGFDPVTGAISTNGYATFRDANPTSFTDYNDTIGGFSITANAVSAVPEPGATATIACSAALLAGLVVRWRRRLPVAAMTDADESAGNAS